MHSIPFQISQDNATKDGGPTSQGRRLICTDDGLDYISRARRVIESYNSKGDAATPCAKSTPVGPSFRLAVANFGKVWGLQPCTQLRLADKATFLLS
jgi:hypothetical protein